MHYFPFPFKFITLCSTIKKQNLPWWYMLFLNCLCSKNIFKKKNIIPFKLCSSGLNIENQQLNYFLWKMSKFTPFHLSKVSTKLWIQVYIYLPLYKKEQKRLVKSITYFALNFLTMSWKMSKHKNFITQVTKKKV